MTNAPRKRPAKTTEAVTVPRVENAMSRGFNPIRNLTPQRLSHAIDMFEAGYLSAGALLIDKVLRRDDAALSNSQKRWKSVPRYDWDITQAADTPEATRQKEAAEYFFANLQTTSAIDSNERGDIKLLLRQMMSAVGFEYAAHEIVWRPTPQGLTAQMRFVPLWFFEHIGSDLRYLETEGASRGSELADGEWMVTKGTALGVPTAIAYMFKHYPMHFWSIYCERYVIPGLHGKVNGAKGSDEWKNMVAALRSFSIDWNLVTNKDAEIVPIDRSGSAGESPFSALVERQDKAIATIWRGGDVASMSADDAIGAESQGEEKDLLEADDAEILESTLNSQVLPWVIWYTHGTRDVQVKFRINLPKRRNVELDIKADTFLLQSGIPMAKADLAERYGRALPDLAETKPEDLAMAPQQQAAMPMPNASPEAVAMRPAMVEALGDQVERRLMESARDALARAMDADLEPLRDRIEAALALEDDQAMLDALSKLDADLPELMRQIAQNPQAEKALEEALTAALFNGIAAGAARHPVEEKK